MEGSAEFGAAVIDSIYDASIQPTKWPLVLKMLCDGLKAQKGHLFFIEKQEYLVSFSSGYGYNPAKTTISADKFRRFFVSDPVVQYAITHIDQVFSDRRVIDPDVMHASEMQMEIRDVVDMEFHLSSIVEDKTSEWTSINIHRSADKQAFTEDDEQQLQSLIPHLKRVSSIQKRLRFAESANTIKSSVLNNMETAVLVVSDNHQIEFINGAAKALIEDCKFLSVRNGKLVCKLSGENMLIKSAIDKALYCKNEPRNVLRITDDQETDVVNVVAARLDTRLDHELIEQLPMREDHYAFEVPYRKFALITLTRPTHHTSNLAGELRSIFGLTQAEATLAICLAEGKQLKEAAKCLGRSTGTVRVQLQSIFDKTNTNRQSTLLRLLLSIP
ncbi:MAG TPA: helix-turn-helix transcriptional regulator [Dongiaceae bacterium]|nr:helix-turn-helix transcriptional regulator [Dongiaceae bacterium]